MGDEIYVRNWRLFYFNDGGKLDIYYIQQKSGLKEYVIFVEWTELN